MNQIIAEAIISFGLRLTAEVVRFICVEVTEEEIEKHRSILQRLASLSDRSDASLKEHRRDLQGKADDILQTQRKKGEDLRSTMQEKLHSQTQEQRKNIEKLRQYEKQQRQSAEDDILAYARELKLETAHIVQQNREQARKLLDDYAQERLKYAEQLIDDIKKNISDLRELKKNHMTEMKKHSLEFLGLEFQTLKNKAFAYKSYMKLYQKNLWQICELPVEKMLCSMTLPEKYPYQGALLYLSEEELPTSSQEGTLLFHSSIIKVRFRVTDVDLESKKLNSSMPLYVGNFDTKNFTYPFSAELGTYYFSKRSGGFSGLPAKVISYDRKTKDILLQYGTSTRLHLQQRNLSHAAHYPPINTEITVYPMREIYDRETDSIKLYVSERVEDTEIAFSFDEIPILFPEDKIQAFCQYYINNNIDSEYDDARIAPMSEDDVNGDTVKIQFQDQLLMAVRVKKMKDGRHYLEYDSMLQPEEKIQADDIFASFHAVVKMYSQGEFNEMLEEDIDSIQYLLMTVYKEFKLQSEIKASQEGTRYFAAWETVVSKLQRFLTYGASYRFDVTVLPETSVDFSTKDVRLRYPVAEKDMQSLKEYLSEQMKQSLQLPGRRCNFFTESDGVRFSIRIHTSCEYVDLTIPYLYAEKMKDTLMLLEHFTIYKEEFAVPEMRQLTALYHFRSGNMVNERLHIFALNAQNVQADLANPPLIPNELYNERLRSDKSQYDAFCAALNEKNWFMIQGPPGTGKTTVICELVLQTLKMNPDAKILIVSQANVAVDNVLRGLLKSSIPVDHILRCGRTEKIAEDIRSVCYEYKYDTYLKKLDEQKEAGNAISKNWSEMLEHSPQRNSDIGELFMRCHQIIGATCVGLAQKNIGLEDTAFDLVIIDEAGKALGPELVIPLIKAEKVVMIGDHKQLPPVIHPALYDPESIDYDDRPYINNELFEHGLFEKLFEACPESNKCILSTQYRMPALIGSMVSQLFYDGMVQNGNNTLDKHSLYYDQPVSLIDMSRIPDYHENTQKGSPSNDYEAKYVLWLIRKIREKNESNRIAVITPYKGQKRLIIKTFEAAKYNIVDHNIAIDTVDAFQGDEAELVIYCTTRARVKTAFYSDFRRLNVAFSRAKNELIILASVRYLASYNSEDSIHKALSFLQENGCIRVPKKI